MGKPLTPANIIISSLCSGLILGMASWGWHPQSLSGHLFSSLAWVGYLPWLVALYPTLKTPSVSLRHITFSSMGMGFVHHALALHWMLSLHPLNWAGVTTWASMVLALGAWLLWASLGSLASGLVAVSIVWLGRTTLQCRCPDRIRTVCWVLLIALALPWAHLALSQTTDLYIVWVDPLTPLAHWPVIRWAVEHWGALGAWQLLVGLQATLAILFVALPWPTNWAACQRLFNFKLPKKPQWPACLASGCLVGLMAALWVGLAMIPPKGSHPKNNQPKTAWVVVQPNLPIDVIRNGDADFAQTNPILATLKAADYPAHARILLPEEGAIRGWVHWPLLPSGIITPVNPDLQQWRYLAQQRQWVLATGMATLSSGPNGKPMAENSLGLMTEQVHLQRYAKATLVPFGEKFPNGLSFLEHTPASNWLMRAAQSAQFPYIPAYTPGPAQAGKALLWPTPHQPWLPSICFELALLAYRTPPPSLAPQAVIVNLSNLGWFHGDTALAQQFWAKGQLAAARFKRPVVISANTGPSGWIDATGHPQLLLPLNTTAAQSFTLP